MRFQILISPNYSAYEPSVSVKLTQPFLYNFPGKVDRYSENNAKMQLEIAKYQLIENNRSVLNAYKKFYFQWIMYKEKIKNLDEAIVNSNILKEQIRREVNAGLADNDDYQGSVSSVLNYENQRRESETALKNIEHQISLYLDIKNGVPDKKVFQDYYNEVESSGHLNTNINQQRTVTGKAFLVTSNLQRELSGSS